MRALRETRHAEARLSSGWHIGRLGVAPPWTKRGRQAKRVAVPAAPCPGARAALRVVAALVSAASVGASVSPGGALAQQEAGARPGLRLGDDGLAYRTGDGRLELGLGGRLHLDAGGGEGRGAELGEGSLWQGRVRRARIEFGAAYGEAWAFGLGLEVATRREVVRDLAVGYSGFRSSVVTVGNFKEPFSFEQLQSNNDITFTERSLANALVPGRRVGAALGAHGGRWTAALGVFGGNVNDGVGADGIAVSGRVTYAPVLDQRRGQVLHLGLAGGHRWTDRSAGFGVEPNPESSVYDVPLIGFAPLRDVRGLARGGVEAAFQSGPYRLQAEYIAARAERDGRAAGQVRPRDAVFHGGYVQLAAVLTGHARAYALTPQGYGTGYAVFGGIEISDEDRVSRGGAGAWEAAARYSFLDLDTAGLGGGRQHNATVGLNWYPERNLRLMLNYVRASGDNLRGDGGRRARADADIVQVRLQIAF